MLCDGGTGLVFCSKVYGTDKIEHSFLYETKSERKKKSAKSRDNRKILRNFQMNLMCSHCVIVTLNKGASNLAEV